MSSLMETLEGVSGIPVQQQMLYHNGRELTSRCVGRTASLDVCPAVWLIYTDSLRKTSYRTHDAPSCA